MSGEARDFNNTETPNFHHVFFQQGKAPREIHTILVETVGEYAPSYATVKTGFILVIFPPVMRFVLDDPKQ